MRSAIFLMFLAVFHVACAPTPPPVTLSGEPELNDFIGQVREAVERHAWEEVIAMADPEHYRIQVAEHGMPEAQYVAELLGLHRVDNDISRNERPSRSDLERIRTVRFHALEEAGAEHRLDGAVELDDGSSLDVQARIAEREGRYLLTGGVG